MSKRKKILNIPNVMTMIRMALIPVYWLVFFNVKEDLVNIEGCNFHIWALIIFAVASLTDVADGYIARKFDMVTDFGKLFDPLADKLMVISVMFSLAVYIRSWFFWIALVMILIKELGMITGGLFMLNRRIVVYSNVWGKAAQACIVISVILSFFHDFFITVFPIHAIMIWIGVVLAYIAGIQYLMMAIRMVKQNEPEETHE